MNKVIEWSNFIEKYDKMSGYYSLSKLHEEDAVFRIVGGRVVKDRFQAGEDIIEFDIIIYDDDGEKEAKVSCKPDLSGKRMMLLKWVEEYGSTGKARVVKLGKSYDFKWIVPKRKEDIED
jgi:hypothetical protein